MPNQIVLDKIKYVHDANLDSLAKNVQTKIRYGYDLMGPVQFLNGEYVQVMYKTKVKEVK